MAELKLNLTDRYITTTYEITGRPGFCIDIIEDRAQLEWDVFLWHKSYGIKSHMFGVDMAGMPINEIRQMALANIDQGISYYIEEYAPELSAENAIELLYADYDGEKLENPEHGKLLECRQEAYHDVYVYEDGYEEYRPIGD